MRSVSHLYNNYMDQDEDIEDIADKNLLNLFRLLFLFGVVRSNYELYGLEWGKRQQYVYRILSNLDRK